MEIDKLKMDLKNTQRQLKLSEQYAESLKQKLNSNERNENSTFFLSIFIMLILSLIIIKLKHDKKNSTFVEIV